MVHHLRECIGAVVGEVGRGPADAAQARHIEFVPIVGGGRGRRRQDEAGQERAARIGTAACDGVAIGQCEHIGAYVAGEAGWTRLEDEAWRRARIYRPRTGGADVVVANSRRLRGGLPGTTMTLTAGAREDHFASLFHIVQRRGRAAERGGTGRDGTRPDLARLPPAT